MSDNSRDPTMLGKVASVSGSRVTVQLSKSIASGLSIIKGQTYRVGQVGSFVRIPQGYQDLFGVVSEVGAKAAPVGEGSESFDTGRWMSIDLVGEAIGGVFERGISQYPNIDDTVHLATDDHLRRIYNSPRQGHITVGCLSSAESIPAKVSLNELITRHSAILGSTGSGKSTTVASLLRSIVADQGSATKYESARVILLDVHGEYSAALADIAQVYSVDPQRNENKLTIPYWALNITTLLNFVTGGLSGNAEITFTDKIFDLKLSAHRKKAFPGLDEGSITVDTPIPFSLKRLWYDLLDFEIATFEGQQRDQSTKFDDGSLDSLIPPKYKPHSLGSAGPFLNQRAIGIQRHLGLLKSRLQDRRYDFVLHPGDWEPDEFGKVKADLDELLQGWLGGEQPITILDLSGVPSAVLASLVGSILSIIYDALFWSREKTEGGMERPLLVVMEEAHRYLSSSGGGLASEIVQKIAKEGRKYGMGAMVVSQRPSEVDETILSQCGTFFALRLSNPNDRSRVEGTLPEGLVGLLDVLPVLRTGEAVITGEAAKLPMRCRITLPPAAQRPRSADPDVTDRWRIGRRVEGYDRVVASWRSQSPRAVVDRDLKIVRSPVEDETSED